MQDVFSIVFEFRVVRGVAVEGAATLRVLIVANQAKGKCCERQREASAEVALWCWVGCLVLVWGIAGGTRGCVRCRVVTLAGLVW
jgi:hypothetical protein